MKLFPWLGVLAVVAAGSDRPAVTTSADVAGGETDPIKSAAASDKPKEDVPLEKTSGSDEDGAAGADSESVKAAATGEPIAPAAYPDKPENAKTDMFLVPTDPTKPYVGRWRFDLPITGTNVPVVLTIGSDTDCTIQVVNHARILCNISYDAQNGYFGNEGLEPTLTNSVDPVNQAEAQVFELVPTISAWGMAHFNSLTLASKDSSVYWTLIRDPPFAW